ncbi:MAG: tetratricopeptide repeat protein [Candidatus Sumerlaeaceae bacterium]|nr:tetratricopeptide repeat protein [Candidatus Sumerlaeaceae bacterium]
MFGFNEFEANSVEATFHEGVELFDADHWEEALGSFEWVIEQNPEHADAHYYRGLALLSLHRAREAVGALRRAVDLSPTDPSYRLHLGYALLASGAPREASAELQQALELDPASTLAMLYHAAAEAAQGHLQVAREELELVLEREPDNVEVRRHYAAVLHKMGEEDAVVEQCERILERQPHNVDALAMLASVALHRGDRPAAMRYLRQQTILDPGNVRAWLHLVALCEEAEQADAVVTLVTEAVENGVLDPRLLVARARQYFSQRDVEKAIADLQEAVRLNDRLFEAHVLLAQALGARGQLRPAMRHAALAVRLRPNDRTALLVKAEIHRLLGDIEGETQCLTVLVAGAPREFSFVQRKAHNLVRLGRLEEALTTLDQYLYHQPRHRAAWLLYAEIAEKAGNEGAAWRAYRRLLGLGRVPVAGYLAYAAFLVRRQKLDLAADVLAAAAAQHPQEATIQACRAAVLENLGRAAEAREHLRAYLEQSSPSGEILWLLGRAHYMLGEYAQALEVFREARALGTTAHAAGAAAPTFPCVVAEAYTLHHLGRTGEGIRLLERTFGQYDRHELEYYEALGELNEFAGNLGKALALYACGLQRKPDQASLHYRTARILARLRSWKMALDHLGRAVALDPALAAVALSEKVFLHLRFFPAYYRIFGRQQLVALGKPLAVGLAGVGVGACLVVFALRYWL